MPQLSPIVTERSETDPRFLRTRQALLLAIRDLIDGEPDCAISVTRLADAAGVSRPTFYQHFADVDAALQQAAIERISGALPEEIPANSDTSFQQQAYERALPVIVHLETHRDFYARVIETAGTAAFFDMLHKFVKANIFTIPKDRDDLEDTIEVLAGGVIFFVVRWLRGTVLATPQELTQRLTTFAVLLHETTPTRDQT
jgi:AcrR family transcriptional regulator